MPKIDITLLVTMQEKLDQAIRQKRKPKQSLVIEKILSLNVELGELANEWGKFKFWKKKPATKSREAMLEEYADGLHFILSLTVERLKELPQLRHLQIQYPDTDKRYTDSQIIMIFNELYEVVAYLNDIDLFNYRQLYHLYFQLGHALGFTFEEVSFAYYRKNEINHERLQNDY